MNKNGYCAPGDKKGGKKTKDKSFMVKPLKAAKDKRKK